MTLEIGVTGSIGAGKSSVAEAFGRRGAAVVDADALASRALTDAEVIRELQEAFGPEVAPEGAVDRAALAARAFGNDEQRRRLEAIVHPRVRSWARDEAARLRSLPEPPPLIVHDVPLLFETGRNRELDAVVVVDAPLEVRIERATKRSRLTADDVRARDAAQWPAERKRAAADIVIDNVGDVADLDEQVEQAWRTLLGGSPDAR